MRPLCSFVALTSLLFAGAAFGQESSTYLMRHTNAVVAGETASSSTYDNVLVLAQESPSGAMSTCNDGFTLSLGALSAIAELPVPIHLHANKNAFAPSSVDLSWSGSDPTFQVFRSFSASDVLDPANLYFETTTCAGTDDLAFQSNLVFYKVRPAP